MFSALKKLVGSEQPPGRDKNIPAGLQSMNQALQRRFAKGVQYNSESGGAGAEPRLSVRPSVRALPGDRAGPGDGDGDGDGNAFVVRGGAFDSVPQRQVCN